jgi:transcriptional regulator with XRE-family HTH domain
MPTLANVNLGKVMKRARLLANMTQIEVADYLGISRWTYIALEQGRGLLHNEWIDQLPQAMRNPVIDYLAERHFAAGKEQIAAGEELLTHKLPVPETRHRRPTGAAPRPEASP